MAITTTTLYRSGRGRLYSRGTVNGQSANASGGEILVADPGEGYKIAIEFLYINCAADDTVTIRANTSTVLGPIVFKAAGQHFWKHQFMKEDGEGSLLLSSNKELQVLTGTTSAVQVYCEYHIVKES